MSLFVGVSAENIVGWKGYLGNENDNLKVRVIFNWHCIHDCAIYTNTYFQLCSQ